MDKKKVGELEGTPIVTGKKNYANEHEYYLTMNEDNTYQKLEQRVSGDKFRLVLGGGGNNYPTVTAGDATKVWQVTPVQKGTKTEEIVIAPMQTMNINENPNSEILQNVSNLDKFVEGAEVTIIFDGVEYNGTVEASPIDSRMCEVTIESANFRISKFPAEITELPNDILALQCDEGEYSVSVNIIGETPIYDYNWAPGVKIPIPTAEDEGKILVVTKVAGDNTSTIVPEQEVPANYQTPLTDVDLKYFVPGNTVTATVTITEQDAQGEPEGGEIIAKGSKSSNSETIVVSGIIKQKNAPFGTINEVTFNKGQEDEFSIDKVPYIDPEDPKSINTKSSTDTEYILVTNLYEIFGGGIEPIRGNTIPYATIKLEYSEPNYEYQLQENSGKENSGNQLRMPDNIVRLKLQGNDFKEYYFYYESLEPLPSGIYLTTFNPDPGDTYYDIYQVMYNADQGTAQLLSPLVVNDGGEVSVPKFNYAVNNSNDQGNFYLIVYDARDEEDGFLIKIGYSDSHLG